MSLCALALIDSSNSPLFISTYTNTSCPVPDPPPPPSGEEDGVSLDPFEESDLTKFSFIIHSALDFLTTNVSVSSNGTNNVTTNTANGAKWRTPKHLVDNFTNNATANNDATNFNTSDDGTTTKNPTSQTTSGADDSSGGNTNSKPPPLPSRPRNLQLGFLGHIVPIDQYRVYGFSSPSGHLLLACVDEGFTGGMQQPGTILTRQRFERGLAGVFWRVYRMYLAALCNPFHRIEGEGGGVGSGGGGSGEGGEGQEWVDNFVKGRVGEDGKYWYPRFERGTRAIVEEFNQAAGY